MDKNHEQKHESGSSEGRLLSDRVMAAIRARGVQPVPRWHFLLISIAAGAAAIVLALALLAVASLAIFHLRDSGLWQAPGLGFEGWSVLLRSLPLLLIGLLGVLFLLFGEVVRRYEFVYQRPFVASFAAIITLVFLGGYWLSQSPLHQQFERDARHGMPPPLIGFLYQAPFRTHRPPDMYDGTITAVTPDGFDTKDSDGDRAVHILISKRTMLPDGADFSIGEHIMAIGTMIATDTMQAFGVRDVDGQ